MGSAAGFCFDAAGRVCGPSGTPAPTLSFIGTDAATQVPRRLFPRMRALHFVRQHKHNNFPAGFQRATALWRLFPPFLRGEKRGPRRECGDNTGSPIFCGRGKPLPYGYVDRSAEECRGQAPGPHGYGAKSGDAAMRAWRPTGAAYSRRCGAKPGGAVGSLLHGGGLYGILC